MFNNILTSLLTFQYINLINKERKQTLINIPHNKNINLYHILQLFIKNPMSLLTKKKKILTH